MHQIKDDIFFNLLIRIIIEAFLDLFFAAVYNTETMTWNNTMDYYSNFVGFMWLILLAAFTAMLCIVIIKFPKKYNQQSIRNSRFRVLAEEFKNNNKLTMLDYITFLFRRAFLCLLIIYAWTHGFLQSMVFFGACLLLIISKLILRPYRHTIMNIQDIIFETLILAICAIFATFTDPEMELTTKGIPNVLGWICFVLVISVVIINYLLLGGSAIVTVSH